MKLSGVNAFFEKHVEQLYDIADRLARALSSAGIEYRIIGGLGVYLHLEEADAGAGRLTRDVDVAVDRKDLAAIVAATHPYGFRFGMVNGANMLLDAAEPKVTRAVHLIFIRERVRPDRGEPIPEFSTPARLAGNLLVASVADLVRMKLTCFRDIDRVHIRDLDGVGLITTEIEAALPDVLRERLARIRATE